MFRVHIDKKSFISSGFSCSNNFGSIRTWASIIWSLIGWWFGPTSFRQFLCEWKMKEWICLNELGSNHQPISDQTTEVKVLIDQNCNFMKTLFLNRLMNDQKLKLPKIYVAKDWVDHSLTRVIRPIINESANTRSMEIRTFWSRHWDV